MIYLDNAATSLIKPPAVIKASTHWLDGHCANPGRGGHRLSITAGNMVYQCRQIVAQLFNIDHPENIIFTINTTMALNIAINGFVKKGMHIVISGMEHNSVYRPVANSGCEYTVAKPDRYGFISLKSIEDAVKENTSLIVVTHASNVVGTINPIADIGKFAKSRGITFLVDCAQSGGVLDIDVERDNIDMLAFAGHKALMGPTGTGGLYISKNTELTPIIFGGTGSLSESSYQPDFLPDRFESGTLNVSGIAGLAEGVKFVLKNTTEEIKYHEDKLVKKLTESLGNMENIRLYGNGNRVGIVSFLPQNTDSVSFCNMLDTHNIAARGGLHCAPLAHNTLGTNGLVRLSVGYFNNIEQINHTIDVIRKITR